MRARLALRVSGVQYELREVSLKSKPAEMLAASPKGTVPVLVLSNGQVIDESLDIMRWALAQSDPDGWLTQASMEDMLTLIAANDGKFKHALERYKYPNRYPQEFGDYLTLHSGQVSISVRAEPVEADATLRQAQGERKILQRAGSMKMFAAAQREKAASWLYTLEPRLNAGRLFGSQASLADMAILPFVRQFAHTDAAWFAAQPWPQLQAWLTGFEISVLFESVMAKHQLWWQIH